MIYHLTTRAEWEAARAHGSYTTSTRDRTLAEEGFIHCSYPEQVPGVVARFYAGVDDLVVLVIDETRLGSPVKVEPAGGEAFPHVYGPIDLDAVVRVEAWSGSLGP